GHHAHVQCLPVQSFPAPRPRAGCLRGHADSTDPHDRGGGPMTSLTVRYDARCGLCCAVASWIDRQAQLVPVACVPATGDVVEMAVVADTGEEWSGDDAWVMVLWALARYRHWAYRLANPSMRSTARALFKTLSAYRGPISC